MSFRYIRVRKKTKRSGTAQEILDRLDSYLNENADAPAKLLARHWKDQQDVLTYQEIRQAILSGDLTAEMVAQWMQDYSRLVTEKLSPVWLDSMYAGSFGQPIMDQFAGSFHFTTTGNVLKWIDNRGASFITSVTDQQQSAVRALIRQYTYGNNTVDDLAKVIRPCIGLTEPQSRAVLRYFNTVKSAIREQHPRMKEENLSRKAHEAAIKYAEKLHRQRAVTVAQTEMAFAYNYGMDQGIRQAQAGNYLGTMEKRWIDSGDANVCDECSALNGMQIGIDDEFPIKGKQLFSGMRLIPPAHPRCACAVEYIEIESPVFRRS